MRLFLFLSFCFFAQLWSDSSTIESIVLTEQLSPFDTEEETQPIDIRIPCNKQKLEEELTAFLHRPLSEDNLLDIKNSIVSYFKQEDDSLHLVQIPPQKVSKGKVVVVVLPARIDELTVSGNEWTPAKWILRNMKLKRGMVVQEKDLLNSAAWTNRNPFIHTDVILSSGRRRGEADVDILTKDRFPARFYLGTDNTGSSVTGNERFFTGVNASIGLYALLTYQYTAGYDFPEFISHFGSTTFFLPWKHEVNFYGGYATIHPHITDFDSDGQSVQGSMRYTVPFKPLYTPFQHQLIWGVDYKHTDSNLFFLGVFDDGSTLDEPVNQENVDLFQFYLAYQLQDSWWNDLVNITYKIETFTSPFKFLPNQKHANYNSLRDGSKVRYFYTKMAFGGAYKFSEDYLFTGLLRGQIASGVLLPTEQYGLGGYDTVRGYQERVFLADNAIIANFEVHFPKLAILLHKTDELFFLLFLDTAYGYNWNESQGFPRDEWLMGIGPGLRYQVSPFIAARLDWGFRIHHTTLGNSQVGRAHFSLSIGY